NVSDAPMRWPSTSTTVGAWWLSSLDASLYGREIGTTRSTPCIPSRPSSATPSGSPIAPIAVVSSPGMTTTWTPVVLRRVVTASISAGEAWGVMTIITAAPNGIPGTVPRMAELDGIRALVTGAAGGGRVVNISMNRETMVRAGFVPYGPAGAGVEALSRVMAADLAGSAVSVNVLLPGGATATGMVPDDVAPEVRSRLLDPAIMG